MSRYYDDDTREGAAYASAQAKQADAYRIHTLSNGPAKTLTEAASKQEPIFANLSDQEKVIACFEIALTRLDARTETIRAPRPEVASPNKDPQEPYRGSSTVASILHRNNVQLADLIARLERMISEMEL